jgi:hypothetical protein
MSEFKFACPVCGQHMAADSTASGMHVECPTCFQKVIVPQQPSAKSKYILSATQYIKPAPTPTATPSGTRFVPARKIGPLAFVVIAVLGIGIAGAAFFVLHNRMISDSDDTPAAAVLSDTSKAWTLNLTNIAFPEQTVSGRIAGKNFSCDRAVLQGGTLTLRQGPSGSQDPRMTLYLFATQPEELRSQSLTIKTNDTGAPRIVIRWDENQMAMTKSFTSGYALRLDFGNPGPGGMPGKIYICLPDATQSFLAGTFNAEIRKASPPKPHAPKPPKSM